MNGKNLTFVFDQILFAVIVILIFMPGDKNVKSAIPFLVFLCLAQGYYLFRVTRNKSKIQAYSDLMLIILCFFILWEILVTKLNLMHPVLVPAPENVFYVFFERPIEMIEGIWASLRLLLFGTAIGMFFGIICGVICGWIRRLRELFYPIANVLAPIPSIVFAPYVVSLMPSFRSASYVVIILGIFWPTFLNMIVRVDSINKGIIDTARTLELSDMSMVMDVLIPFVIPGVVSSLKVTLTTAFMMLTFAEMMGATSGMGYFIVNYNTYGNYTNVVAGIIVIAFVVTILSAFVTFLQKKLIRWEMY